MPAFYSSGGVLREGSGRRAAWARSWHWCEQYGLSGEPQNSRPQIGQDFLTLGNVRGMEKQ